MRPAGAPPTVRSKKTLSVTLPESPAAARAAKERREEEEEGEEESVSLRGAATDEVERCCSAGDDDDDRATAAVERVEAERTAETTTERAPRVVASVDAWCSVGDRN